MNRRIKKFIFFLVSDALLIALSLILAFFLRFDGHIPLPYHDRMLSYIALTIGITLPIFILRGLYAFTWTFVSFHEMLDVIKATLFSGLLFTLIFSILKNNPLFLGFPRSIIIIQFGLIAVLVGSLRAAKRIILSSLQQNRNGALAKPALIIGADAPADQLIRTLQQQSSGYKIVGILEDMPMKQHTYLHGIPILGQINDLPRYARLHSINTIIIALPEAARGIIQNIFNLARSIGIQDIKIVPSLIDLLSGKVALQQLRPVRVEDLLGREPTKIETAEIERFITGKDVLITGAAGSIGSELARQVSKSSPHAVYLLDYEESNLFNRTRALETESPNINFHALIADVRNVQKIAKLLAHIRPQVVFHAAAYKHVPLMEVFPEEAVLTNVFGTLSVASAAITAGVEKFILISTDKAVRPVSIMGQTKKLAEMIGQAFNQTAGTKFISVRFGNVLGSRGSVIPIFEEQIKNGQPITVTDPQMTRFFMTTTEAVLLVLEAAAIGQGGEVFVLDMGEPVKIVDLARELIKLSGLEPEKDIPIIFTGARAGEKIKEELLTAEEGTTATRYQKIFRAKTSFSMNSAELFLAVENLKTCLLTPEVLHRELAKLVSTAQPTNTFSSFEGLRFSTDTYKPL